MIKKKRLNNMYLLYIRCMVINIYKFEYKELYIK